MREFSVDMPIEKSRYNDEIILKNILYKLYDKIVKNDVVMTGQNASQCDGQSCYAEIRDCKVELDPYSPYVYLSKDFQTFKKYVKNEIAWYKSQDLSIIGHEGIEDNATWQQCATQDEKKEVNSNYGWCTFSEENGSQYDNALKTLTSDKSTRNAILVYTRPSIYKDYKRDGMHDMICSMYSHFFIRNDRLFMSHHMRSNDVRFGFIGSDISWYCFIYQNMYEDLKKVYPELKVGTINWHADSMHIYDRHFDALKSLVERRKEVFNE